MPTNQTNQTNLFSLDSALPGWDSAEIRLKSAIDTLDRTKTKPKMFIDLKPLIDELTSFGTNTSPGTAAIKKYIAAVKQL